MPRAVKGWSAARGGPTVLLVLVALTSGCVLFSSPDLDEPPDADVGAPDASQDVAPDQPVDATDTDTGIDTVVSDTRGDAAVDSLEDPEVGDLEDADRADPGSDYEVCVPDQQRCDGNQVMTCNARGDGFEAGELCTDAPEGRRCLAGECVEQPEGYGELCEDAGDCSSGVLVCVAQACVTHEKGSEGTACWDELECTEEAPICFDGLCQDGGVGDACDTAADCGPAAPLCSLTDALCVTGAAGDSCAGDADCALGVCIELVCQSTLEGARCRDDGDCDDTAAPICSDRGVCQDGGLGDECGVNDDCDLGAALFCSSVSACSDGGPGRACGHDGECVDDQCECADAACTATVCTDGTDCGRCEYWSGSACTGDIAPGVDDADDSCGPGGTCTSGGVCGNGSDCVDNLDCAKVCIGGICGAPSSEGGACDPGDDADCGNGADTCNSDDDTCTDGTVGDPCGAGGECDSGGCDTDATCLGAVGETCGDDADCLEAQCECADETCSTRMCTDGSDCGLCEYWDGAGCTGNYLVGTDDADDSCGLHGVCSGTALGACVCDADYYGETCAGVCPGGVGTACGGGHGVCDDGAEGTGTCTCDEGFYGEGCDWGAPCLSEAQCASDTHCSNGHCAPLGFAYIPAGTFWMGSPSGEAGRGEDEVRHRVTLTRPFFVQVHEVTQAEWLAWFSTNPSYFSEGGGGATCGNDCPVETVNWWEALAYANALSGSAGLPACYTLDGCADLPGENMRCTDFSVTATDQNPYGCGGYRLPTEAEWEYADRAGMTTAFYSGDITATDCSADPNLQAIGWYCGNAESTTHPVERKAPNGWGLYDMNGNVNEWVWDWVSDYPAGAVQDPLGVAGSGERVLRSGTWNDEASTGRSGFRAGAGIDTGTNGTGLRIALTAPPASDDGCADGYLNGDETDVDCGGSCSPCADGRMCLVTGDCGASSDCSNGHCAPAGYAFIPSGSFWMGSPDGTAPPAGYPGDGAEELGRETHEGPLHEVFLTGPFFLSTHEVTQSDWLDLMGNNPSQFSDAGGGTTCGDDCPVEIVNWWEAIAFANALSDVEGLERCYAPVCTGTAGVDLACTSIAVNAAGGSPYECEGYRLPTEAEWEYAYRAESFTALYNGDISVTQCELDANLDAIGWYCGNTSGATEVVGQKEANDWGLYDIAGNVVEWVWDGYGSDYYASSPSEDPLGLAAESDRVVRGGSWLSYARRGRAANRTSVDRNQRMNLIGFRQARTVLPEHCQNGALDPLETDIDCGGACAGCQLGDRCRFDGDCRADTHCSYDHCAPAGYAFIPAGTFWMGSPDGTPPPAGYPGDGDAEPGWAVPEGPLHEVGLSRPFYLSAHEVTQGEWLDLMGNNPSSFSERGAGEPCTDDCPVESVSWWDAIAYVNALSAAEGLPSCYATTCTGTAGVDLACTEISVNAPDGDPYECEGYRLPTEAEWEYAYRAGSITALYNGDISVTDCSFDPNLDAIGWYCANASSVTHVEGQKDGNAWGLYDMAGNVWEWLWDWYSVGYYSISPAVNPLGPSSGDFRVNRGGAWSQNARFLRAGSRNGREPEDHLSSIGFRPARTARPAHCENGSLDESESGVDCGGPCAACELGDVCGGEADCGVDAHCSNDHCAPTGYAYVPAGTFWMGSPEGCPGPEGYPGDCTAEPGRDVNEGPLHEVTLRQPQQHDRAVRPEGSQRMGSLRHVGQRVRVGVGPLPGDLRLVVARRRSAGPVRRLQRGQPRRAVESGCSRLSGGEPQRLLEPQHEHLRPRLSPGAVRTLSDGPSTPALRA